MCAVQHENSALLILSLAKKTPLFCNGLPHGLLLLTIMFSI